MLSVLCCLLSLTIYSYAFLVPPVIKDFPIPKLIVDGIKFYALNKIVTVTCIHSGAEVSNVSLLSLSPSNQWISLPVIRKGNKIETTIHVTKLFHQKCCVENARGESKCSESRISTAPSFSVDRPTEPGIPLDKTNVTEGESLRFTCWAPPNPEVFCFVCKIFNYIKIFRTLVLSHRFSPDAIRNAVKYANESGHYLIADSYVRGTATNKFTCEIHVSNHYVMQKTEQIKAKWPSKNPLPIEAAYMNVSDLDYDENIVVETSSRSTVNQAPLSFNTATIVFAGMAAISALGAAMLIVKCRNTVKLKRESSTLTPYAHVDPKELGQMNENNILGKGAFGMVYRGEWLVNGITYLVAYKVFSTEQITSDEAGLQELRSELNKLKSIPYHPHIITLLAATTTRKGAVTIVMELCERFSLRDYTVNVGIELAQLENSENQETLAKKKSQFVKELVCYAVQICRGMEHLHTGLSGKCCLHMDLAARNVLRKNGLVMISDFGMAHLGPDNEGYYPLKARQRPLEYYAPECLGSWNLTEDKVKRDHNGKSRFSKRSDVWSFGIMLHEIFSCGVRPIVSYNAQRVVINGVAQRVEYGIMLPFLEENGRLEQPSLCPDSVFNIIRNQCWQFYSQNRPEFSELNIKFTELLQTHFYNNEEMEVFKSKVQRRMTDQEDWRLIVQEAENKSCCFSSWQTCIQCCASTTTREENIGYSLEKNQNVQEEEPTEIEPLCVQQDLRVEVDKNATYISSM